MITIYIFQKRNKGMVKVMFLPLWHTCKKHGDKYSSVFSGEPMRIVQTGLIIVLINIFVFCKGPRKENEYYLYPYLGFLRFHPERKHRSTTHLVKPS